MIKALIFLSLFALLATFRPALAAERPGPSPELFSNPYYKCANNYYVSTTGSDLNNGTSPQSAWQTLQHANDVGRSAGDCVNVVAGTYNAGLHISHGGNYASDTGYVVYRCMSMDACIVTDVAAGGQNGSLVWDTKQPMAGNYIIIDGFTLTAKSPTTFGQGVELWTGSNNFVPSVHHVWIMNSRISGYGQSGIQMNGGEYFFVIHNEIYRNSGVGCSAQGSGISFVGLIGFPNYAPTADDNENHIVGKIGGSFHNEIAWNVLHDNAMTACGNADSTYNTDGNNIIIDTLNWEKTAGTAPYASGVLIAFNVTYNAGGGGIHIFNSEDVTVANNTCYNNYLDPFNSQSGRGCMDSTNSYGNKFFNNIAVAVPVAHASCAYNAAPFARWNSPVIGGPPSTSDPADVFENNITYVVGTSCQQEAAMFRGDVYSCMKNKCSTDPGWINVQHPSPGTENSGSAYPNFALRSDSPAIGYGLTAPYLPSSSIDVGACARDLKVCP